MHANRCQPAPPTRKSNESTQVINRPYTKARNNNNYSLCGRMQPQTTWPTMTDFSAPWQSLHSNPRSSNRAMSSLIFIFSSGFSSLESASSRAAATCSSVISEAEAAPAASWSSSASTHEQIVAACEVLILDAPRNDPTTRCWERAPSTTMTPHCKKPWFFVHTIV